MPDNRASLKESCFTLNPDQNDHGSNRCNRRCRVHGYTQLAMVGIAVDRVDMGHLDHSQQRQQDQTHQSACPESARPSTAIFAHLRLKSYQFTISSINDTYHWTRHKRQGLRFLFRFSSLDLGQPV